MKKKFSGFTLIELLVVIAIIGILASLVMAIGGRMTQKAQIKNTQGTILALVSGCEQYRAVFYLYPDLDHPPSSYPGSNSTALTDDGDTKYVDSDFLEYNKRLLYTIEGTSYVVDEKREGPFLTQALPKLQDPSATGTNIKEWYCDAWGRALRICPGRDHSANIPKGPNNYNSIRASYPPDIFSLGPDAYSFDELKDSFEEDLGDSETSTSDLDTTDDDFNLILSWFMRSD